MAAATGRHVRAQPASGERADGAGAGRADGHASAWRSSCRPCRSTSGAPTCSKARRPRSTRSCQVASKAAALALLVRVAIGFGTIAPAGDAPGATDGRRCRPAVADAQAAAASSRRRPSAVSRRSRRAAAEPTSAAEAAPRPMASLAPVRTFIAKLIAFIAIITCTFGNLAAYGQTNIKRLLAYSTIAHAGYMMMPVAAAVALAGIDHDGGRRGDRRAGVLHRHLPVHEPGRLRRRRLPAQRDAERRDRRLRRPDPPLRRCTVVCFALILFSLIGLPPLAGLHRQVRDLRRRWSTATRRSKRRPAGLLPAAAAGRRRPQHGDQPVLLPARREGDDDRRRAARPPAVRVLRCVAGRAPTCG